MGLLDMRASIPSCINVALTSTIRWRRSRRPAQGKIPRHNSRHDQDRAGDVAQVRQAERNAGLHRVEAGRPATAHCRLLRYQWSEHGILGDLKTTEKMPSSIKVGTPDRLRCTPGATTSTRV